MIMEGADRLQRLGLRSVNSTPWPKMEAPLYPPHPLQPRPFPTALSFTVDEGSLPGRQGEEPRTAAWHLQP